MPVLDEQWRTLELPTPDAEIWRYSRIAELDLAAFEPAVHRAHVSGPVRFVREDADLVDLYAGDRPDVFAELNTQFAATTHVVVPDGEIVEQPIVVTHVVPSGPVLVCPRLVIEGGRDSQVTVIERFASESDEPALVVPLLQVRAGDAARVQYLGVQELSATTWSIGHQ